MPLMPHVDLDAERVEGKALALIGRVPQPGGDALTLLFQFGELVLCRPPRLLSPEQRLVFSGEALRPVPKLLQLFGHQGRSSTTDEREVADKGALLAGDLSQRTIDGSQISGGRVLLMPLGELPGDQATVSERMADAMPYLGVEFGSHDAMARTLPPALPATGALAHAAEAVLVRVDVLRGFAVATADVATTQERRLGIVVVPGCLLLVEPQAFLHGLEGLRVHQRRDGAGRQGDRRAGGARLLALAAAGVLWPPTDRLAGVRRIAEDAANGREELSLPGALRRRWDTSGR